MNQRTVDQGSHGPLELFIMHMPSGILARPDWEYPLLFKESWQATCFMLGDHPMPPDCEFVKVFGTFIPRTTFGDLLKRANASALPFIDTCLLGIPGVVGCYSNEERSRIGQAICSRNPIWANSLICSVVGFG